jgi:hypothetical protein
MAFSWQQQIYPAGAQNVNVDIAYLDKTYIYVYLDGVLTTNYTWASDSVIRLDDALTQSTEVLLVRRTTKEYLFILFASGAPFISENLDTQNTQFLHLAQEMVEGRSIEGFYGDISMNGFKITNLADGTEPGDAINKSQLDEVDTRVTQLEQTWVVPSSSYPWFTNTTEETDVLTPGYIFTKAAVYINGVCQTPGYSYEVVDNTIMLADPVPVGTHIMARLGEDVPNEQGYATAAQLANTNTRVTAVEGRATAIEAELVMLNNEVDQDLAALQNLTTVVEGKASKGVNSDITALLNLEGGIKGVTAGAPVVGGYVGEIITAKTVAAITATSGTAQDVISLQVPAGAWEVTGLISGTAPSAAIINRLDGALSTTTGSLGTWDMQADWRGTPSTGATITVPTPPLFINSAATSTVYLVGLAAVNTGAPTMQGKITARRIR